jgi:hypothetical protein
MTSASMSLEASRENPTRSVHLHAPENNLSADILYRLLKTCIRRFPPSKHYPEYATFACNVGCAEWICEIGDLNKNCELHINIQEQSKEIPLKINKSKPITV